ncbi:MAG: hypothetical protein J6Z49_11960 [Kiritimatiellae bacterium]|nr:hypothetical protein [Kiritimatiellia bacterium]
MRGVLSVVPQNHTGANREVVTRQTDAFHRLVCFCKAEVLSAKPGNRLFVACPNCLRQRNDRCEIGSVLLVEELRSVEVHDVAARVVRVFGEKERVVADFTEVAHSQHVVG